VSGLDQPAKDGSQGFPELFRPRRQKRRKKTTTTEKMFRKITTLVKAERFQQGWVQLGELRVS